MTTKQFNRFSLASLWPFVPFLLLVPSIVWIWMDIGSFMWDQASYADDSVRLYDLLNHGRSWLHAMLSIETSRAPGMVWFGQFFVGLHKVFGNVERTLLFYMLLLQIATVWITYDMCSRLAGGRKLVGAACGMFITASPLFVGLGHEYFVETFQLLVVAWTWRLAIISPEISRRDLIVMLALVLALGMAAKVTTPLFAGPPLVLAGLGAFGLLLRRSPTPRMFKPFTLIIVVAALAVIAGLTCAWYIQNYKHVLAHMIVASGKGAIFWGTADPFLIKFGRWLGFSRMSFLPAFLLYAAIAAVSAGLFIRIRRSCHFERVADIAALGALFSILVTLTVYSLSVNEDYRFALPLLPIIAVILAWSLSKAPAPLAMAFLLAAFGSGLAVQGSTFGVIPPDMDYPGYLRAVNADLCKDKLKQVPEPDTVRINSEELSNLVRLTSTAKSNNRLQICAVQYHWLNCNLLRFYAAKEKVYNGGFLPSYATNGLDYGESDLGKVLQFIKRVEPEFIISVREDLQPPPDFVNAVNIALLTHLRADPGYEQVDFPSRLGIVVFRRVSTPPPQSEIDPWQSIQSSSGYYLLDVLSAAKKTGGPPGPCQVVFFNINGEQRKVLFQHPVQLSAANDISFAIPSISPGSTFKFGIGMNPDSWAPEKGDGVEFSIQVEYDGVRRELFKHYIDPKNNTEDRRWHDFEINMDEFANKKVSLIFQTKPGPAGDISFDWAGWSGLEMATRGISPSYTSGNITRK